MHSSIPDARFGSRKRALLGGRCAAVRIQTLLCYASEQHLRTETRGCLKIIFLLLFETAVNQLGEATQE